MISISDYLFGGGSSDWAITDSGGGDLLPFYSFISASIQMGGQVVSEPVELGSFTSYNKTSDPAQVTLELAFQGERSDLQQALTQVKELKESTDLFSIVTPYYEFENMTLQDYSFEWRTENGLGSVVVSLTCVEVREVEAAYGVVSQDAITAAQETPPITEANAADPSDVSTQDTGMTATAAPTTAENTVVEPKRKSILRQMEEGWA